MDKPTRNLEAGYPLTDLRDDYGEAWMYIEHLEGMLGAGNLCEGQVMLRSGSESDTKMRERAQPFEAFSMTIDGVHRDFADSAPVLIEDKAGVAVWRFYRKAGH